MVFGPRVKYTDYTKVPWIRRASTNGAFVLLQLVTCGFFPLLLVTCIVVLTGDVYYKQKDKAGYLKVWSPANRIAAVILLLMWGALAGFIVYAFAADFLRPYLRALEDAAS